MKSYSYRYWGGVYEIIYQNECIWVNRCSSSDVRQKVEQLNSKLPKEQVSALESNSLDLRMYSRRLEN